MPDGGRGGVAAPSGGRRISHPDGRGRTPGAFCPPETLEPGERKWLPPQLGAFWRPRFALGGNAQFGKVVQKEVAQKEVARVALFPRFLLRDFYLSTRVTAARFVDFRILAYPIVNVMPKMLGPRLSVL